MNCLPWAIYLSFLGAAIVLFIPRENKNAIRWTALLTGILGELCALKGFFAYRAMLASGEIKGELVTLGAPLDWIPQIGSSFHLAVDGINLPLVLLNGFICVTGLLYSWNIENRVKEFHAFFLALIGGVYGVFMAMDLFLLFVFYEIAIIPKYFVIAIWGSTRKEYGAMKLVLYSFVGSALVLVGMLAVYFQSGIQSFDILALANVQFAPEFQRWCFPLVFVGFAVLAGMWPFHTWAPTGHVAAPTAASMLLAGVVMKLGAYGCLRVAMLLFPYGLDYWKWWIAVMAVIGIVYGAGVAMVQRDFKFVIGYSSVSHMGFVLLGLATINLIGINGAVLQMFSHGIIAGLLFAVVGRMVYDRTHTRQLEELGGLWQTMKFTTFTFVIAGLASMGLPGFSGFVAELQVLIGTWRAFPVLAVITGIGILVTVAYTLITIHKAFFAEPKPRPPGDHAHHPYPPVTWQEAVASIILMGLTTLIGLYPNLLLDPINASAEQFVAALTSGAAAHVAGLQ
jgi:NADH-quinone oxidoreductase subunit M